MCSAPFEVPEIAVAVAVELGGGGSKVAAPIARDVALFWRHRGLPPVSPCPAPQHEAVAAAQAAFMPRLLPAEEKAAGPVTDRA